MKRDPTVLILYARYGAGHIQVAEALKQAFLQQDISRIVLVDLFHEAHPLLDAATQFIYRKSFTWFPAMYGWTYYRTQHMDHDRPLAKHFNSYGLQTLRNIIKAVQPDLVINTFPMLVMPEWRRQSGQRIPTYAVLTDFVLHNRWIHPEIDRYYVATEDLAKQLVEHGVRREQVVVSGIPIRASFLVAPDAALEKQSLVRQYNLSPHRQKVLLVAGGYGVPWHWVDFIQLFHQSGWEVLVVCGHNESLQKDLLARTSTLSNVQIFGYVEQMEELMKCADLLITKAGGITLSEAMSLALPTLILSPVPGQELDNARYLEAKGAACVVWSKQDILQIQQLITQPATLHMMRQRSQQIGQKRSAERIVADIRNLWSEVITSSGTC